MVNNVFSPQEYKRKADSAWLAVDSLELITEFASYSFRVGFLAYTPVMGLFNPLEAKWIIFLYYGNDYGLGISDHKSTNKFINQHPNPFTSSTTISYTLSEPSTVTINIFNPQGQLIEKIEQEQPKGEHQMQWNAEGLPAGMYYFRIQAGEMIGGGKLVKMK